MKVLLLQIRREFWEHRVLWIAPVALCLIFLVMCGFVGARFASPGLFDGVVIAGGEALPPRFSAFMHIVFTTLLYALMAVVTFFYLADCLYSERKDRSILFWKSLPVSDAVTVLSKLLVALVAVPLVVFVLSFVTNLIASGIFKLTYPSDEPRLSAQWTWLHWLKLNSMLFVDIFVLALWFAPVAAYQLLVSAWARRAAFIWTVLPLAALVVGERLFFNSWAIWDFLVIRLGGVMFGRVEGNVGQVEAALRGVNTLPLLARPDLWIGVVVAIGLLYATIQIRRHRDDT